MFYTSRVESVSTTTSTVLVAAESQEEADMKIRAGDFLWKVDDDFQPKDTHERRGPLSETVNVPESKTLQLDNPAGRRVLLWVRRLGAEAARARLEKAISEDIKKLLPRGLCYPRELVLAYIQFLGWEKSEELLRAFPAFKRTTPAHLKATIEQLAKAKVGTDPTPRLTNGGRGVYIAIPPSYPGDTEGYLTGDGMIAADSMHPGCWWPTQDSANEFLEELRSKLQAEDDAGIEVTHPADLIGASVVAVSLNGCQGSEFAILAPRAQDDQRFGYLSVVGSLARWFATPKQVYTTAEMAEAALARLRDNMKSPDPAAEATEHKVDDGSKHLFIDAGTDKAYEVSDKARDVAQKLRESAVRESLRQAAGLGRPPSANDTSMYTWAVHNDYVVRQAVEANMSKEGIIGRLALLVADYRKELIAQEAILPRLVKLPDGQEYLYTPPEDYVLSYLRGKGRKDDRIKFRAVEEIGHTRVPNLDILARIKIDEGVYAGGVFCDQEKVTGHGA